jgi:NAD(P)-dependent dehydrogenase (short-subunit alcohol dehydrogenase family)/uncharacterized protein YndB with AHSA1/START domain
VTSQHRKTRSSLCGDFARSRRVCRNRLISDRFRRSSRRNLANMTNQHAPVRSEQLDGQTALITGASRGLGLAIAQRFAEAGAKLSLVARSRATLEESGHRLSSVAPAVRTSAGDVTDADFMQHVVEETEATLGPISILINNAGMIEPIGPLAGVPHDEWWRCVAVNLGAPALAMQLVLPRMCARNAGRIINVVSGAAIRSSLYYSAYTVAKTALVRLVECAAEEVRPYGVQVFAMEPSTVATDMSRTSTDSPAGRRWIPWFKRIFTEGWNASPNDIATRALELARGDGDALSGVYIPLRERLDDLVAAASRIRAEKMYSLRMARLPAPPPPPSLNAMAEESEAAASSVLQLRRLLQCSRERSFALWESAALAAAWFAPATAFHWLEPVRSEVRVGGKIDFHLAAEHRVSHTYHEYHLTGTFIDVVPAERLVLDWSWTSDAPPLGTHRVTTVTVEFLPYGEATEVVLTHEGLPTAAVRDAFIRGWQRCLAGMERVV